MVAVALGRVPVGCVIVVVAVDMVGAGVIVIVGGFIGGFTVSAVPVLPDPSAGESSG